MDERIDDLPVMAVGTPAGGLRFDAGASFWDQVGTAVESAGLEDRLDAAMGEQPAPRIWLVAHEPGRPELSCTVALGLARALAARDQATLVLDCDEDGMALTIWSEREETEGWIDVARYGTSVLSAGVPLPFSGRRGFLLGVGSFAPTDVTGDEIGALLGRLRRHADDIILVTAAAEASLPWAGYARIRLLCWDPATRSEADLPRMTGPYKAAGAPLTGLVRCDGLVVAGPGAAPVAAPEATPGPEPEELRPVAEALPEPAAETDESGPAPVPDDPREPTDRDWAADPDWASPDKFGEPRAEKRSSGVFWFGAIGLSVIVVIMAVYLYRSQYVPAGGHFGPASGDREAAAGPTPPPETTEAGAAIDAADSLAGAADSIVVAGTTETGGPAESPRVGDADTTGLPAAADNEAPEAGAESGGPEPRPDAAAIDTEVGELPAFDMAPYDGQPGADGWALHVYSLADSASAAVQVAELERRGFATSTWIVHIENKGGRWWRIYVGSFATRREAADARPALYRELGIDWADPTRLPGARE